MMLQRSNKYTSIDLKQEIKKIKYINFLLILKTPQFIVPIIF